MIKITGKLWLLALCLSLIVSIPLASSADNKEKNQNGELYSTGEKNVTDLAEFKQVFQSEQKFYVCLNCGKEYLSYTKPDKCTNEVCEYPQAGFEEKNQTTKKIFVCSSCKREYVDDTKPDKCTNCGKNDFEEKEQTTKKIFVCSNCKQEYFGYTPPKKCTNELCPNPQASFTEKEQTAQKPDSSGDDILATVAENKGKDRNSNRKNLDDSDQGILHTVLTITPWLLVILCLIFVWINIFFLRRKLEVTESQLKKIVTPKSEGASELNTNRPKGNDLQLEERVSELERVASELKEVVHYLLQELETRKKENKEEQRPQESSQWRSLRREIPANNQRIHTESTTRSDQLSNKGISTSSASNKSGLISGANRGLRLSPEIQKIIVAFNRMMLDSTKLDEGSMDLRRLRNNFIKDYNVIAFKCVNSQERVNHPEEQPRFEMCQPSESTLWRIQLSDGTFAVMPGLREYESIAHFHGGMKELFNADYKSGTYRKIEVIKPAIVKRDFSINEQGELRLS